MIIDIESDGKEIFMNAKLSKEDDKLLAEKHLAQYLVSSIEPIYEFYLFLCDETWNVASKMIVYKGLWKQEQNKLSFSKYSCAKEYSFYNQDRSKIMFASCFKINKEDIYQALRVNSDQISKHSFLFLTKDLINFDAEDIFKALNIFQNKYGGNDWNNLKNFAKKHKIIPIQKWENENETCLRFFLYENIQLFKE